MSLLWHSVTLRRYTIGTATHHGARMTRRLPRKRFLVALLGAVIINVSCTGGNGTSANDDDPSVDLTDIDTSLEPLPNDLQDSASFYLSDGYDEVSMLNMLVRTATVDGPCNADDIRGCQLDDVLADLDDSDDLEPAIAVHFSATDYSDDASEANAHLRQSGDTERAAHHAAPSVRGRTYLLEDRSPTHGARRQRGRKCCLLGLVQCNLFVI